MSTRQLFSIVLSLGLLVGCSNLGDIFVALASAPVVTPIGYEAKISDDRKVVTLRATLQNIGVDDAKGPFDVLMEVDGKGIVIPGFPPQTISQENHTYKFPASATIPGKTNAPPAGGIVTTDPLISIAYDPNVIYNITIIVDAGGNYAGGANKGKNTYTHSGKLP
ncbi:hypothetical protein [Ralstonia solanacearum]|uniref:hypothetical protein n=1 Tax=Ralstonia solanacearum TaxID=305 RepID=UPI000AE2D32A|nr:hypothetical protein [Ralstonia solanacearum]